MPKWVCFRGILIKQHIPSAQISSVKLILLPSSLEFVFITIFFNFIINVRGCNHADVRAHAQPHHDDDDVDEPDYFLVIGRNYLIFLYNSL